MKSNRRVHAALALLALALIVGCNSGGKSNSRSGTANVFPPTSATLQVISTIANSTSSIMGLPFVGLTFGVTNITTGLDVTVSSLSVQASGTLNDAADIVSALLILDQDADGRFDAGEPILASVNNPFTVDDGFVTFSNLATPAVIPAQGRADLLVFLRPRAPTGGATDLAVTGDTIALTISSSLSVAATTTSTTTGVEIQGPPITGTPVTLGIWDHVLISEVYMDGTTAEFIELYNPTGQAIDLTNYHLADFTENSGTPTQHYYRLSTGANYGPGAPTAPTPPGNNTSADFTVRFPAGTTIAPGQVIVIAVDGGAGGFATQFPTVTPRFALRNAAGATQPMLVWDGVAGSFNFTPGNVATSAGLTDAGEQVFLFTWNGQANPAPDIITDVDIVGWGVLNGTNNYMVDKSGVATDGPDAGGTTTMYLTETDAATQEGNRIAPAGPPAGMGMVRISWFEGAELVFSGNGIIPIDQVGLGIGGHDETSEDWISSFMIAAPTPGVP